MSNALKIPETSMLVTNEVLADKGVGRAGVIAEVLDLAATDRLRVHVGNVALKTAQRFSLELTPREEAPLDQNQADLLKILFATSPDAGARTTLAELEGRAAKILPEIDELQTRIRKGLKQGRGEERYYGMDPKKYQRFRTPAKWTGRLGVLGLCIAKHKSAHFELPFLALNGWAASLALGGIPYLGISHEMREKLGIQMRGELLLSPLEATRREMYNRLSNGAMTRPNASEGSYTGSPELQQQYQRALALSVLLKMSGYWLQHISRVSDGKHPAWLIPPEGEYARTFEDDTRDFIITFSDICDTDLA